MLPADQHVHTQWSADAPHGSMAEACAHAVATGLAAVTFTDHADLTTLVVSDAAAEYIRAIGGQVTGGIYRPPALDADAYLDSVAKCQSEFAGRLEIAAGVELGDPHQHPDAAAAVSSRFEFIVGSVHSLRRPAGFADAADCYVGKPAAEVVTEYLAEVTALAESSADFTVLAHVNYAARYWPADQGRYRNADFEGQYRVALRALARSGRAMEINTSGWLPLDASLLTWWREEGGQAVSFGSDAHDPLTIGHQFVTAAALAQAAGFGPGRSERGLWVRC
jgi:histidinol-phosphatase (PHP family)